ncbi:P2Y purinoceptor 14-like [Trematomus bernacchii]|uniref:P2Y purinoceptor 14-like n=1 Tax=Trematomus bernacchii TaxID=40690 RepID=UPI00146B7190|nr:P2Y purinoceptor 14-like [Trematomus bernacchii]
MVSNNTAAFSSGCASINPVTADMAVSYLYLFMFPIALLLNGVAAWVSLHLRSTSTFIVYLKNLVAADLLMTLTLPSSAGVTLNTFVVLSMESLFWLVSIVIVFCYICITLKVLQSFRNSGSNNSHGKTKTKLRVFLILLVFFVCFVPLHVLRVPVTMDEEIDDCVKMWVTIIHKLFLWVSATNSCLDPLLYICLCREYREKLVELMKARGNLSLLLNGVAAWVSLHLKSTSNFVVYLKNLVAADIIMTLITPIKAARDLQDNAFFWIVSVVLAVCYISIANKVIQSFRNSGSSNNQGQKKIKLRVFLVVVVFFVSFGPYHIVRIPYTFQQVNYSSFTVCNILSSKFTKEISLWLASTNICVVPILYVFLCREFKEKLVSMITNVSISFKASADKAKGITPQRS